MKAELTPCQLHWRRRLGRLGGAQTRLSDAGLLRLLRRARGLESLAIDGRDLPSFGAFGSLTALPCAPSLASLTLQRCSLLTKDHIAAVPRTTQGQHKVPHLLDAIRHS